MRQSRHSIVDAKYDSPPKPDISEHLPSASSTARRDDFCLLETSERLRFAVRSTTIWRKSDLAADALGLP